MQVCIFQLSKELPLLPGWDEECHHICLQLGLNPFYSRGHEFWRRAEEQMRVKVLYCSPVAETHRKHRVAGCGSCVFKACMFYRKQTMDNNLKQFPAMTAFCNCSRLEILLLSGSFTASKPGFGLQCCKGGAGRLKARVGLLWSCGRNRSGGQALWSTARWWELDVLWTALQSYKT